MVKPVVEAFSRHFKATDVTFEPPPKRNLSFKKESSYESDETEKNVTNTNMEDSPIIQSGLLQCHLYFAVKNFAR